MLKAYAWLTFCVIVWGSNFIFGKLLVMDFSPTLLTSLRLLFIVLFLFTIAIFQKQRIRIRSKEIIPILILGIIGVFLNHWSFFTGLQTADPTISALILATTPILAAILAAIFLKEKLSIRTLFGSLLAIAGIYLVVTNGKMVSFELDKGLLWIVVTMVSFAIMIILTKLLSTRIDPLSITLSSNMVGLAISIPFVFILDKPLRISWGLPDWAFLIGTAIIVHGLANLIWNSYIRHVDASKASILSNLEPFVTMIMGLLILFKPITVIEILGSIIIIGGVVISTYHKEKTT